VISVLLLAAGSSRRMGQPKLLLELGGRPLVRRAVEQAQAAGVDEVIVVVGPNRSEIERALEGATVRLVDNPDHLTGMASSLRAGLRALGPDVEAIVVLLGDQPFQGSEVIPRLIEAFRSSGKPIVAPLYAGRRGNPVLFDRSVFPELERQTGDQGGREVIAVDPARVASVEFASDEAQRDLDTWDDYLAARAAFGEAG
jgi:molybdenum cofactor cytidylyltransferase